MAPDHVAAPIADRARRPIAVVGAPSSIGIRPYDDGGQRRLDLAPAALRRQRLVERLGALDFGDVVPPAYRDFVRRGERVRNEEEVAAYSLALADAVAAAAADGAFVIVLGGDCSVVLGALLGVGRRGPVGLVYLDAHADFATPQESRTGSAASMDLALAVGRGDSPLARLGGASPLVAATDVALVGRRDEEQPWYGQQALGPLGVLDLGHLELRDQGASEAARRALERVTRSGLAGFWIHFDADVLDPEVMPAVDSPEPDGVGADEAVALLAPLVRHPRALGLEVTIYDPALDPGDAAARRLVDLLVRAFGAPGPHSG